jgi:hypothetical protein
MLTHSFLDDISNVFERGSKLLKLVVAESDVVGDITLVASDVKSLRELCLSVFKFLFFVEDATLNNELQFSPRNRAALSLLGHCYFYI